MSTKTFSVSEAITEVINRAKKKVIICFKGLNDDYQEEKVIGAIKRGLDRGVIFTVLVDPHIDLKNNPMFKLLQERVYIAPATPRFFFVVADTKHIVFEDKLQFGNRVSGVYLLKKFREALLRSVASV